MSVSLHVSALSYENVSRHKLVLLHVARQSDIVIQLVLLHVARQSDIVIQQDLSKSKALCNTTDFYGEF
jgi:hypothetical protein